MKSDNYVISRDEGKDENETRHKLTPIAERTIPLNDVETANKTFFIEG